MAESTCRVDDCERVGNLVRGMCPKHYRYWLDHTPAERRETAPRFVDDFWSQIEKTHEYGCWLWVGTTDGKGYGRWKNRHLAHREVWRRECGDIPVEMMVLHICDQPPCVNPRHLYLGTIRENTIDAVVRGRWAATNLDKADCPAGHPYTDDNVYIVPKTGARQCKTCNRVRSREVQRRRRAARKCS